MCILTSFLCPTCGIINDHGIRICDSIRQICCEQAEGLKNYNNSDLLTHCPDFVWPPIHPLPLFSQLCEECILEHHRDDEVINPTCANLRGTRLNDKEEAEEWAERSDTHNNWVARLSEIPHRRLTLRIPCCNICKKPIFFVRENDEYENTDNTIFGIEGVEFEFNSALWKWLCLTGDNLQFTYSTMRNFPRHPEPKSRAAWIIWHYSGAPILANILLKASSVTTRDGPRIDNRLPKQAVSNLRRERERHAWEGVSIPRHVQPATGLGSLVLVVVSKHRES